MNKVKIRIAIVDDHQIVIDGIKNQLLQGHADFEIVIETTDRLKWLVWLKINRQIFY